MINFGRFFDCLPLRAVFFKLQKKTNFFHG
jgi:hypothetical protein